MSDAAREAHVTLKLCLCDLCGVAFGIPAAMYDQRVAFRSTVCCPNGHVRLLGVDPPHERRIQQLEALVTEKEVALVQARAEQKMLRMTIVDRLLGPTAPEAP